MKDKTLIVKVDDQFIEKVDYLQKINDFKNRSDTVRKVVEKEYRKEAYLPTPKEVSDFSGKAIKEKEDGR